MDHKELRAEISKNWLIALDYLLDTGRVKSYRQFEELTGIRNQRISGLKLLEKEGAGNNYVSVDYLRILHEQFNISLNFLLYGQKPILEEAEPNQFNDLNRAEYGVRDHNRLEQHETQLKMLNKKIELLEKELELMRREFDLKTGAK